MCKNMVIIESEWWIYENSLQYISTFKHVQIFEWFFKIWLGFYDLSK